MALNRTFHISPFFNAKISGGTKIKRKKEKYLSLRKGKEKLLYENHKNKL